MKLSIKKIAVIVCFTVFSVGFFSTKTVCAAKSEIESFNFYNKRTQISEVAKRMVYLTTTNRISDTQKNKIINLVIDEVKSKIKDTPSLLQQEESLDPDIYAQKVEEIFNKNITNVNSFDTAILSLGDIVYEWVKDTNVYSDQNTLVNNTWMAYSIYDFGFVRKGLINAIEYQFLIHFGLNPINPAPKGYVKETVKVPVNQTNLNQLQLTGYYKNQDSDTTIVAVGGFRGNGWPDPSSPEYGIETKMLEDLGYNVLLTEPRASGESEGQYITMGYYEKDDYAAFVNNELSKHPNQKIILYGGSMGASTALGSLQNDFGSQIKAIIAIAGYKSIRNELVTVLSTLNINGNNIELILKNLENRYLTSRIQINLEDEVPMEGVFSSSIPKLLLHGDADTFVLPSNSQALLENAAGSKNELYFIPGGTHSNLFNISNPENSQFIKNHIEQFLTKNDLYPE
ncbi:alpha/beta hydrolase [Enterococcus faecalis]